LAAESVQNLRSCLTACQRVQAIPSLTTDIVTAAAPAAAAQAAVTAVVERYTPVAQ